MKKSKKIVIACSTAAAIVLCGGIAGISYAFWSAGNQSQATADGQTGMIVTSGITLVGHSFDDDHRDAAWVPYDQQYPIDNMVRVWEINLSYSGTKSDMVDNYSLMINYNAGTANEMQDCMYVYNKPSSPVPEGGGLLAPINFNSTHDWEKIGASPKEIINVEENKQSDPSVYNFSVYVIFDSDDVAQSEKDVKLKISLAPFPKEVDNGGFETGDLTGWTIVDGANKWGKNEDGSYKGVISDSTYWGDAHMPYNQSGRYHLDGWNTGIDESYTWSVRSTVFKLSGSGWITVKMAGRTAAVKVYKADGTQIGLYKQTRFNDVGHPIVNPGSWADMATYAIDLSDHIGEKLYIELCDNETGENWGQAFFDEVKTYYATAPDWEHNKDTVQQSNNGGNVDIPWVKATNTL